MMLTMYSLLNVPSYFCDITLLIRFPCLTCHLFLSVTFVPSPTPNCGQIPTSSRSLTIYSPMSTYFTLEDLPILRALIITCMLLTLKCLILSPNHAPGLQFYIISTLMSYCHVKPSNSSFYSPLPSPFHT